MRGNLNRFLVGAFVCTTTLMVTGCYNMNGYVMNASGHGYYEQGNYAMAAREFQSALQSNPYNPDYMANLAKTKMKTGDPQGAEQLFRQALTASPSHQPSYHGMAELMLAQGRGEEAHQLMNTWASTQPYVAESHVELAWVQKELGQNHAAAQSLQRALQVNPSHSKALAHLGQYYQETGQPAQAIAMYQQSLQSDWNQPEVHSQIATAAERAGQNHPMGEMAMSRGMHPQSLALEQFGQNNHLMAGGVPMAPQQQFSFQPNQSPVQYQPQFAATDPQQYSAQMPPLPVNAGVPAFSPLMGVGVGSGAIEMTTGNSNGVIQQPSVAAAPSPIPDPAFANTESSVAASPVSQSTTIAEVPEVTAF